MNGVHAVHELALFELLIGPAVDPRGPRKNLIDGQLVF
jgi:hypothetical protein